MQEDCVHSRETNTDIHWLLQYMSCLIFTVCFTVIATKSLQLIFGRHVAGGRHHSPGGHFASQPDSEGQQLRGARQQLQWPSVLWEGQVCHSALWGESYCTCDRVTQQNATKCNTIECSILCVGLCENKTLELFCWTCFTVSFTSALVVIPKSNRVKAACLEVSVSSVFSTFSHVFSLSHRLRLTDLTCDVSVRALSSASARTATLASSVRNMTPVTTDRVATTAPAPMSDRGTKDATSLAAAHQVCLSLSPHYETFHSQPGPGLLLFENLSTWEKKERTFDLIRFILRVKAGPLVGKLNVRGLHWSPIEFIKIWAKGPATGG